MRFVGRVVIKLIEIALRIMGFPFALIGNIISNAQAAYNEIKNDPIKFLKNLLKAVKQGFVQFFGNILGHLVNGVGEWLFGQLGDAGITIPPDFSFQSILGMVFQILGITKEKIFDKLKQKVGPERWARIEGTINQMTGVWSFLSDIFTRGPIAIWEKIQEKLTGLWDTVVSAARGWIMTKIIEQVTVKLLSFLDPTGIMAVVNSFIAFFRAIQSAIQYMIPMLEMLNSFLGGIVQIAQGNIQPAADLLERTMARGMPILIGFLANQVGLGRIGDKIKEVIESIQAKVDEGLQWVIDKAWEIGGRLLEMGRNAVGTVRDAIGGLFGLRKQFRSNGKNHKLYFQGEDVIIESTPTVISTFISDTDAKINTVRGSLTPAQLQEVVTAKRELLQTYSRAKDKRKEVRDDSTITQAQKDGLLNELSQLSLRIINYEKFVDTQINSSNIPQTQIAPGALQGNNYGGEMHAKVLTIKPPASGRGTPPGGAAQANFDATDLNLRKGNNRSFYVLGHLLNQQMHGSGTITQNITPITQNANRDHSVEEEKVKNYMLNRNGKLTDPACAIRRL
jgi:hypothetical protein